MSECETYEYEISCANCEENYEYSIHKGVTIKEFTEQDKCENCGCIELVNPHEEEEPEDEDSEEEECGY